MPHSDTGSTAGVTAAALAFVEGARRRGADAEFAAMRVRRVVPTAWESDVDIIASARADVPLLAAYALAGLALRKEIEEQWGPGGDALAAYDAAVRAAGEVTP